SEGRKSGVLISHQSCGCPKPEAAGAVLIDCAHDCAKQLFRRKRRDLAILDAPDAIAPGADPEVAVAVFKQRSDERIGNPVGGVAGGEGAVAVTGEAAPATDPGRALAVLLI